MQKDRKPTDLVKSCYKMESGLRLGQEGVHACQLGPFSSPIYFTENEAAEKKITKQDIIEKRKWIFELLNDEHSQTPCKGCSMVVEKPFSDVRFDLLGHMDLAATTTCNLRCNFCGYTHFDSFDEAKYDALAILKEFSADDVTWNSAVDFNGGEPTLLRDFDEYIKFFDSRKTRVFLFTNGLIYKQSVYDGLISGAIRWTIVSLDAGTKNTYKKMKRSPKFDQVLENIARYSEAGSKGGGGCSVKYIFHEDNSNDDDILGFCYAMLAIRPQEVWLTFDFDPLCKLTPDCPDLGGYDYSRHLDAYAKTYLILEKHGLKAVHYAEKHLAPASKHGVILLEKAKQLISQKRREKSQSIKLVDFRNTETKDEVKPDGSFSFDECGIEVYSDKNTHLTLKNRKVMIAPASPQIKEFVSGLREKGAEVAGILDRDKVLQGKEISGVKVTPYKELFNANVDMVLVATANTVIEPEIIKEVRRNSNEIKIFTFTHKHLSDFDRPVTLQSDETLSSNRKTSNFQSETQEEVLRELIRWSRHTP